MYKYAYNLTRVASYIEETLVAIFAICWILCHLQKHTNMNKSR